jgi:hypothetical protein
MDMLICAKISSLLAEESFKVSRNIVRALLKNNDYMKRKALKNWVSDGYINLNMHGFTTFRPIVLFGLVAASPFSSLPLAGSSFILPGLIFGLIVSPLSLSIFCSSSSICFLGIACD